MKQRDYQRSPISLEKGAIFVSDVHYQKGVRERFEPFLSHLLDDPPPQLFLMGDIFDLLVAQVDDTLQENQRIIELLNRLAASCQVIYLEGNHDFNLKSIFPAMMVVSRSKQPLIIDVKSKRAALLHGDLFTGKIYEFYTTLIRNPVVLKVLNRLNKPLGIYKKIQNYNASKVLCQKDVDLSRRQEELLKRFGVDLIIEGHFHQNILTSSYINLPAFACGEKFLRFDGSWWRCEEFVE